MKNILTIDVEEWFHANYNQVAGNFEDKEVRVVENTERILELLDQYESKATFFVLGYIAEKHPSLLKEISKRGHEVASHGYAHELVYKQGYDKFKQDVAKAIKITEDVIGEKILGYRAPSWSLTEKSLWAWEVLEDLGLKYDASVFPVKNYLYGLPTSPRNSYNPVYEGRTLNLLEIPCSTARVFGKNIPFSGGFYLRVLPYTIIDLCIKSVNKENLPAIMYLHPREIDVDQPRLNLKGLENLIHYYGISTCEDKFVKLLSNYKFASIRDYYNLK